MELWERSGNVLEAFERVSQAFPNCECENCSFSKHSCGPVAGNEIVARTLYSPPHFNEFTGQIRPNAYVDVYKRGLSVNRLGHTTLRALHRQAGKTMERSRQSGSSTPKTGYVLALARCEDLMNLRFPDGSRMCCFFDTAGRSNRAHADVVYARFRQGKTPRSRREQLARAIAGVFELADANSVT